MPRSSPQPVERTIADAAEFDLSETDEGDIGSADRHAFASRGPRAVPNRDRADRADAVVALCALLVFKDRRRKIRRGTTPLALPGL